MLAMTSYYYLWYSKDGFALNAWGADAAAEAPFSSPSPSPMPGGQGWLSGGARD